MNTLDLPTVGLGAIAVVPIVIAICQAIKIAGVPNKWMPFISIGIGIAIGFIADHDKADLTNTILNGVIYGLSASGLYSGIKATSDTLKVQKQEHHEKR